MTVVVRKASWGASEPSVGADPFQEVPRLNPRTHLLRVMPHISKSPAKGQGQRSLSGALQKQLQVL